MKKPYRDHLFGVAVVAALCRCVGSRWRAPQNEAAIILWLLCAGAHAESVVLNDGWHFMRGDVPGAEVSTFDDQSWRRVAVPHDWSIEDLPGQTHPFDAKAPGRGAQGYMLGGVGWYRRTLVLPPDVASKTVLLRFEAVYMDAQVWVNGELVTRHPYGYSEFLVDISRIARPGDNVVAVRVNHEEPSSRWYSGSGIIRPVRLEVLDKVHIDPWGPSVTTPEVSTRRATVKAATQVANDGTRAIEAQLSSIIVDAQGREVKRDELARAVAPGGVTAFDQSLSVGKPALWSIEDPDLYTLVQELRIDDRLVDSRRTRFGIRSISFDAEHGFRLNGKRVLLKGGAIHHDNYMLGAAGIPRADERKLELMKAAGYNAVRSAHNPISRASLDAADRLGMLVIDEAFDMWSKAKNKKDYARFFPEHWRGDVKSMIAQARNHPSVIMWSIGNEIPNMSLPPGHQEAKDLAELVRSLDPTRPVTAAAHIFNSGTEDFLKPLDVAGYNYYPELYASDHRRLPQRVMYGSESFAAQAFDYVSATEEMPWVLGDFVWSAFDYMGESAIGWLPEAPYPWHLAMTGEIDVTGKKRPATYYRQVLWKSGITPTAAFVEWPTTEGSLPNGTDRRGRQQAWVHPDLVESWDGFHPFFPVKIVVFSENEEVELFVDGQSMGRKPVSRATEYKTQFWARYKAGELKVVGYHKGKPASQWIMRSADKPAAIRLTVDRPKIAADGDDLAYIAAELVDSNGVAITSQKDDKLLAFKVSGAASLAGVGNGHPAALESFQSGQRSTFRGRAVAVVRSSKIAGTAVVDVSGPELPAVSASVTVGP